MKIADHVTLNCNNNEATAVIFLDIEKYLDTTWHLGLLYKLSKLHFSISLMKLIALFFLIENAESRSKVKCLRQGTYNQGFHNVPYCSPHYI
jgi:hypothetical protein